MRNASVPIDRAHIEAAIKHLLVADLEADPTVISDADTQTALIGRGIGLDSIEALRLALGLEKEFDIRIPDADLTVELFSSLGTLVEYVHHKILEPKEG